MEPNFKPRTVTIDPERSVKERRMPEVLDMIREDLKEIKETAKETHRALHDEIKQHRAELNARIDKIESCFWSIAIGIITGGIIAFVTFVYDMVVKSGAV